MIERKNRWASLNPMAFGHDPRLPPGEPRETRRAAFRFLDGRREQSGGGVLALFCLLVGLTLAPIPLAAADAESELLKSKAYELYEQKHYDQAAESFQRYLEKNPADAKAALDYASLLSQLNRHEQAAQLLENVHQRSPENESAYFKLAVEYVTLKRFADAERVFTQLEQSANQDMANAAAEANRRLKADVAREARSKAEQRVFELASQFKNEELFGAIADLEKQAPLSFALEMQRLYALHSLRQYAEALERANKLAATHPTATDLGLLRADLLAQLGRYPEAAAIWREIERENAGTAAATQASKRLQAEAQREVEQNVFELAREKEYREVVAAVDELEKKGAVSFSLEMQRLYALQDLHQYKQALKRAEELAATHPKDADLALLRADLLAQSGKWNEAEPLLTQIARDNAGTPVAAQALKQLEAMAAPPVQPPPEARIYELANRRQYREVVAAIDELETQGELSLAMGMQRLYALQALGESARAAAEAEKLTEAHPESTELAVMRADLLIREHQWEEAGKVLRQIKQDHPRTPVAAEAERRLQAIPPIANLDKSYWGEAYLSGDYLSRFSTVVGSGFIRHGYFIPQARWLQPYAEMRFTVDTRSGGGAQRTIVADNFAALSLGLRVQPFPTEYFFFYAQGGLNKDFLERRHAGAWAEDYQAGLYGFKSWGPGTVLHTSSPGEEIPTTGNIPSTTLATGAGAKVRSSNTNFFWRGDWFTDAAADFSYYNRFSSWIGYGQAHEGFRLFQVGPHSAIDAYAVENVSWDVRGNYFDNLFEIGPGARWLWVPRRGWEVILRTEWPQGFYFGRDDLRTRRGAAGQYDDLRVGLSVGLRW